MASDHDHYYTQRLYYHSQKRDIRSGPAYPGGQEHPNLVAGYKRIPKLVKSVPGGVQWYDPADSGRASGTFGNLGRDTLTGPNTVNFDFGTEKATAISSLCEVCSVQFRGDLFNIFNHPNLGLPLASAFSARSTTVNGVTTNGAANPLGPIISTTNTTSRQIQFALKFIF